MLWIKEKLVHCVLQLPVRAVFHTVVFLCKEAGACELRLMWLKDRLCVVSVFAEVPDGPSQFVGKQM